MQDQKIFFYIRKFSAFRTKKSASNRLPLLFTVFFLIFYGCENGNKTSDEQVLKDFVSPKANDDFFQEISEDIGLDFVHSIGAKELKNIVESVGGGAAFLD